MQPKDVERCDEEDSNDGKDQLEAKDNHDFVPNTDDELLNEALNDYILFQSFKPLILQNFIDDENHLDLDDEKVDSKSSEKFEDHVEVASTMAKFENILQYLL